GGVGIGGEVIVLLQIGRGALGTLVVPGLVAPGPMQRVAGFELLTRVEMEPALTALLFRAAIPGDAERLIASPGKGDQILLQRIYPEGVGDRMVVRRAIRTVGADHEFVAIAEKGRRDTEMLEPGAGEIAEHRRRRRGLHRQSMMRALPCSEFR